MTKLSRQRVHNKLASDDDFLLMNHQKRNLTWLSKALEFLQLISMELHNTVALQMQKGKLKKALNVYKENKIAQFDFNKSLTEEINIKNIKCFSYVSCIYDTFWWQSDWRQCIYMDHTDLGKISAGHLLLKYVLSQHETFYVLSFTAPTAITGRMYQISHWLWTNFESI